MKCSVIFIDSNGGDFNQGDIGGGGTPSDGGGVPGTPAGSTTEVPSGLPPAENGGVFGTTWVLLVPVQDASTGIAYIGFYDTSDFDDSRDGSFYAYRMEDIAPLRVPTVRRVILIYRDIGTAKLTISLTGTNDKGNVVSNSRVVSIGTAGATGALITKFVDLQLTAFRPQLSITRAAGGGPFSITSATLVGEYEEQTL